MKLHIDKSTIFRIKNKLVIAARDADIVEKGFLFWISGSNVIFRILMCYQWRLLLVKQQRMRVS